MKSTPKILTVLFLLIFILQMLGMIVMLALPSLGQAEEKKPIEFTPQVEIPVSTGDKYDFQGEKITIDENSIGIYIKSIYKYAIGIVGIVAAVVLMMGGVIWLTAGGNQTRVGEAKSWIGASLTGLIIALTSYMILATVNPALVEFKPIKMAGVEESNKATSTHGVLNTYEWVCINSGGKCSDEKGDGWLGVSSLRDLCGSGLDSNKKPKPDSGCSIPKEWKCCQCIDNNKCKK